MLFSRAFVLVSRSANTSGTSAMNPKNADTTERFGPNPSFKTQYGYALPMISATTNPMMIERAVSSGPVDAVFASAIVFSPA